MSRIVTFVFSLVNSKANPTAPRPTRHSVSSGWIRSESQLQGQESVSARDSENRPRPSAPIAHSPSSEHAAFQIHIRRGASWTQTISLCFQKPTALGKQSRESVTFSVLSMILAGAYLGPSSLAKRGGKTVLPLEIPVEVVGARPSGMMAAQFPERTGIESVVGLAPVNGRAGLEFATRCPPRRRSSWKHQTKRDSLLL